MDGNKDESEDCIRRCKEHLSRKNYKKAQWFASKAHQLYPSETTKSLLEQTSNLLEQNQDEEENSETNSETFNNREQTNETSSNEQPRSVDYIKHCKDYYEILVVKKTATELEIKKQYKKLALQFHPDKNKSPGASEAFKAISAAFAVLSDPEKRRRYDERGNSDDYYNGYRSTRRRSDGFDYSRGFEEEFNADEIFNMFFGRGFFPTQNVYVYRNGTRYSHSRQTSAHHHHQQNTSESQATAGYTVLLQIMPILFFICISLLSNFVPDNPYSLSRSHKYPYQRFTENFQVPYFVKENFERDYKDTIHQIESHVEEAYISNLQTSCFKERNYKENLIYRAKFLRDSALESKAQSLRTPSCDKLVQIEKSYYSSN